MVDIEGLSGKDKIDLAKIADIINSIEEQMDDMAKKYAVLEKLFQNEKESRLEEQKRIDKALKENEVGIKNANAQLANIQGKHIEGLNQEIENTKKAMLIINEKIKELQEKEEEQKEKINNLEELQEQFKQLQKELEEEKRRVVEKDNEVKKLEKEKDKLQTIKTENEQRIEQLQDDLLKAKESIGSLKIEKEQLEEKFAKLEQENEQWIQKYNDLLQEFNNYKEEIEPSLIQNTHIKRIMQQNIQGQIYLLLEEAYPLAINTDELARRLDITPVQIKTEIMAMQELGVIKYSNKTREVTITDTKLD